MSVIDPPGPYARQGYIPMCQNKTIPGPCCLYDESAKKWFKLSHRPCVEGRRK